MHAYPIFLQFKFRMELFDRVLAGLASSENDPENLVMNKNELIDVLNTMRGGDRALEEEAGAELGKWIGSFLVDNGYAPHTSSVLMKQMFISSFPPLSKDREFTEENVEGWLLRSRKVLSNHVELESKNTTTSILAQTPHSAGWW